MDHRWPMHPSPRKDELLISWLIRLADANGVNLQSICHDLSPSHQLLKSPLDRCPPSGLLEELAKKSNSTVDKVRETTLWSLAPNLLMKDATSGGHQHWLMPVCQFTREGGGQQFCPSCLEEAGNCYYKKSWRLGFTTICEHHGRILSDVCPSCGHAKRFIGCERSVEIESSMDLLTRCLHCGLDLRVAKPKPKAPAIEFNPLLWEHAVDLQSRMTNALEKGWIDLPGVGPTYSNLFFEGVRQVLKLLVIQRAAGKLEPVIRSMIGENRKVLPSPGPGALIQFELMGVQDRNRLMGVAGWLLDEWPNRFIQVTQDAGLFSNVLLQDGKEDLPFWYANPVREHRLAVFSRWRDPNRPKEQQISYGALAARKTSERLYARETRIEFIRSNPQLVQDLIGLARAMKVAGLYSTKSDPYSIAKTLGKLVRSAMTQDEWWRLAGAPVGKHADLSKAG